MPGTVRPASDPRVAIVTVAYRSDDVLPGLLHSVPTATTLPVTTIVADNSPDEGRAAQIAADFGARYLAVPGNPGYGGAVNAATAGLPASVEWIVVVNPDVVLAPGSIDALVTTGEGDDHIGAVGPHVVNEDGSTYPSARAIPSLRTGIGHALFSRLWAANPWTRRYRDDRAPVDVRRDAGWLSGSCVVVRRRAFDELGGFDDGYFMYFEDVDLGYRLGQRGYRNVYEPAAQAIHAGAHSTSGESARMLRAHHASARRFLTRKYSGWWLWPVRVVVTAGLGVRSAITTRRARD
ncbi:MAG: glycosyltransferase family 2 protein [Pseudolysinimonas sp.]|uniref:glycosyltransferase family 2 protein n=1 Tax=Pseudolysinimonas sp. TaxID=2680009 RepID=UPI0032658DF6